MPTSLSARYSILNLLCCLLIAGSTASAAEWWERPWDCKVAPNPNKKKRWYLECVNDLGGTPEKDNQRDIAKSLGRVRKFREQTVFRALESREMSEVAAMGKGPMVLAISEATPKVGKAEKLIKAAIPLQKGGKLEDARAKIDEALKLLAEGETTMEVAIAVQAEKRHLQHLRNAAAHTGLKLERKIRKLEKRVGKEVRKRIGDLKAAVAEQQDLIDTLREALAANPSWKEATSPDAKEPTENQLTGAEFRHSLDTYQYLLNTVAKSGDRAEMYQGDTYLRDAQVSDLQLGAVSSVARRDQQLRFKLRQLSNRMSAAAGKPVTGSLSDEVSAELGSPIDDLDHFTRSKFGWVKSNRLIGNHPWNWEFNYTPPDADAISLAGRWEFQIDPKFVGEKEQWYRADQNTEGWRNIYAPNWWEREGSPTTTRWTICSPSTGR